MAAQAVGRAGGIAMTKPMDDAPDEPAPLQVDLAEPTSREALAEAVRVVRDAAKLRLAEIEQAEAAQVQQQRQAEREDERERQEEERRRQQARAEEEQEREDERERLRQWRDLLPGGDA
jgi:hypothetical protein